MAEKKEQFEVDLTIKEAKSDDVVKQMEENNQLEANQIILTQSGTEVPAMPVGSIFVSAIPLTDARVHILDGSTISQTGIYETFANLIKALVSAGNPISCSQSQFNTDVTATGNCGKFVIDDTSGTIRLPKITTFIQGLSDITNIGSSLQAGLPNITGTDRGIASQSFGLSGAFYEKAMSGTGTTYQNSSTDTSYTRTAFDASRSSSIYGKSNTVQPNATQYPYYIVLASGYKSSQVVDIDNIMNEVDSKIASQVNEKISSAINSAIDSTISAYIIAREDSGTQHYRLYSDGTQEYFGVMPSNNNGAGKVTFSHAFKSVDDMCITLTIYANTRDYAFTAHCDVKSTTSIETECFQLIAGGSINHINIGKLSYRVIGPKA